MAGTENSTPASRRGFMGGLAALPLIGTGMTVACAQAPCHVAGVVQRHAAATAAYSRAEEAVDRAWAHLAASPDPQLPAPLVAQADDEALGICGGVPGQPYAGELVELFRRHPRTYLVTRPFPEQGPTDTLTTREPWPEAQARADEIVAAWDALLAARYERARAAGVGEAGEAETIAYAELRASGVAVALCAAPSTNGLLAKARLVARLHGGLADLDGSIESATTGSAVALSIVRDLLRMADQTSQRRVA